MSSVTRIFSRGRAKVENVFGRWPRQVPRSALLNASGFALLGRMRLLRILMPKGILCWCLLVIFLLALGAYSRSPLFISSLVCVCAVLLASAWLTGKSIPSAVFDRIESFDPMWRMLAAALLAYLLIAGLASLPHARSFRSWWEPIFLRGGAPFSAINSLAIFGAVVAAGTQFYERRRSLAENTSLTVRGARLITHDEAIRRAEAQLTPGSDGFVWGGVRLSFERAKEHFLVVGESGSGKTTTIHIMLKSVLRSIKPGSNRRAVIFDAKRDHFATFASFNLSCPVQTLHPFDARGLAWDLAKDITDPLVAIEIATILVPEKPGEQQPYFPNAARMLLSGVLESFLRIAPGKWTLRDVVLALRYPKRARAILKASGDTGYLAAKFATDSQGSADVASTLEIVLRRLSFIAAAWEDAGDRKLSLEEWVQTGESVLLLGRSPSIESTLQELNRAIIYRLSQLILDSPDAERADDGRPERQTWVVLDELRDAGKMDQLHTLLVEGRSKGAAVVLGFQDVPGLHEVMGQNLAKEVAGLCGNKAFLRTTEPTTQKYASECLGEEDIDLPRVSTTHGSSRSYGRNHSSSSSSESTTYSQERISRPLVLPSQFASDLPRPSPKVGITGYYFTAAVGDAYLANIPGPDVTKLLPPVDFSKLKDDERDFVPRYPKGSSPISLKEWTMDDLERLNLKGRVDLLETEADKLEKPSAEEYQEALARVARKPTR